MKVSEQMKVVKLNVAVSNHRFFNIMMEAVKQKIEEQVPGLNLRFGGKAIGGSSISASLKGEIVDVDGDADEKVRQTMDALKNPSSLMSLLE